MREVILAPESSRSRCRDKLLSPEKTRAGGGRPDWSEKTQRALWGGQTSPAIPQGLGDLSTTALAHRKGNGHHCRRHGVAEDNGTPRPQPAAIFHMAHGTSQHSQAGQPRGVTFLPWCLGMRKHWSSPNMAWAPKRDVCLVVAVCSAWLHNPPSR